MKSRKKKKKQNLNAISPPQKQLDSLLKYYQNGRFNDAEKLAVSITKDFPKYQFGWKVLGAVLGAIGKKSEALDANQTAVALSPQDAAAQSNLGNTLRELGRLDDAIASYTQAIALKPDYAQAHSNLGVSLQELGRLDEALASYIAALKLKPNFIKANENISSCIQSYIWRTLSGEFEKNKFFEETIELEKKKLRHKLKEHPLWFIDIPRTSSKTICKIMWNQFGFPFGRRTRELDGKLIQTNSPLLPNHTHAFIAKYLIGDKIWEEIQTFSIVRNPYSWCLSLWNYCKENETLDDTHNTFLQFLDSLELNLKPNIHERKINHKNFMQTDYLLDNDETLLVKRLLPFEDREKIKYQFRGMGINYSEGIHINKSKNSDYTMSRIEKKKVEQIFAKDFEILGY